MVNKNIKDFYNFFRKSLNLIRKKEINNRYSKIYDFILTKDNKLYRIFNANFYLMDNNCKNFKIIPVNMNNNITYIMTDKYFYYLPKNLEINKLKKEYLLTLINNLWYKEKIEENLKKSIYHFDNTFIKIYYKEETKKEDIILKIYPPVKFWFNEKTKTASLKNTSKLYFKYNPIYNFIEMKIKDKNIVIQLNEESKTFLTDYENLFLFEIIYKPKANYIIGILKDNKGIIIFKRKQKNNKFELFEICQIFYTRFFNKEKIKTLLNFNPDYIKCRNKYLKLKKKIDKTIEIVKIPIKKKEIKRRIKIIL